MKFNINGKEHELVFSFKFLNNLNEKFKTNLHGIEIGTGLQQVLIKLSARDVTVLEDIISASAKPKASTKHIQQALEDYGQEYGDYDELMDQLGKELSEAPATKTRTKEILEEAQNESKN